VLVALQAVVAVATVQGVIAGAAPDSVVAFTALNIVGTSAAVEHVIARLAVDGVVAVARVDGVVGGVARQRVIARRGGEHLGLDGGHVPHRAVGELEVLHHVARCTVGVEVALHRQAVVGAIDANDQVVTGAGERHAGGGDARAQQDGVGVGANCFAVVVVDGVLARAFGEDVGVGTRATAQVVVAAAAVDDIVAVFSIDVVVTALAEQDVIAIAAVEVIHSSRPHHQIRPRGAGEVVFGGGGDADCPAAQFFAECAQVGGSVELGDEEVGGVPIQVLQTSFASSAQKLDQINDPVSWARCNGLLECSFKWQI